MCSTTARSEINMAGYTRGTCYRQYTHRFHCYMIMSAIRRDRGTGLGFNNIIYGFVAKIELFHLIYDSILFTSIIYYLVLHQILVEEFRFNFSFV